MKKAFYKILAITMALVVLFSTMSFTVNSHFCGDNLVGVSYFGKAESCGMEMKQEQIKKPLGCSVIKKNCCNDKTEVLQGQDELKTSKKSSLNYQQQVFLTSFYYAYVNLFKDLHNSVVPFKDYVPPLVIKDIQVLDEVYLI